MHDLIPMHLMRAGQIASISQILGQPDHIHRLEELGLRGGSEVTMVRPGSPCIIRLGTQRMCFRCDDLTSVLVQPRAS